jgi:hypothetical protein
MPDLLSLLDAIEKSPGTRLEHFTAYALDQVVSGFRAADVSCAAVMDELHAHLASDRLGEMSPLVRIHLDHRNFEDGARAGLSLLRKVASKLARPPAPAVMAEQHCVSLLVDAIEQRRSALFLSEPSVVCLFHFLGGYFAAMEQFEPAVSTHQQQEVVGFEHWIGEAYSEQGSPWQRVLSVYEGPGLSGLEAFARHWRASKLQLQVAPD